MYLLQPGESKLVETNPDPVGLKLGIIYDVNVAKKELLYHRFSCKNDGTLNITEVKGDDISYYGYRGKTSVLHAVQPSFCLSPFLFFVLC